MASGIDYQPGRTLGITVHGNQQTGQGYGGGQTGPAAPPQPGVFETLEKRLNSNVDQAAILTQRLATLADRLLGSRPQAVQEGNKDADHSSALARLDAVGNRLDHWLMSALEELGRLERL